MLQYANLGLPHAGILWPVNQAAFKIPFSVGFTAGGGFASWADPQTIPLGAGHVTAAGDCLVLATTISLAPALGVSGLGATWVITTELTNPTLAVMVGYNCTAGGTSISVTGALGLTGDYCLADLKGILSTANPIRGSSGGGGAPISTVTTGSTSYALSDILIGAAGSGGNTNQWNIPSTWSNGGTDNLLFRVNADRATLLTYQQPVSGASTTYSATYPVVNALRGLELALKTS